MQIKLKIHYSLKKDIDIYLNSDRVDINEGTTIERLLETYGIRQSTVVITLNNKIVPKETVIQEEDIIEMYPILIGG